MAVCVVVVRCTSTVRILRFEWKVKCDHAKLPSLFNADSIKVLLVLDRAVVPNIDGVLLVT